MENVIISGADGFIGSYTTKFFLEQGKFVLALDIGKVPNRLSPHPKMQYVKCDISKTEEILDLIPRGTYDTFVHFAWKGSSGQDRNDYNLQIQNALDTYHKVKSHYTYVQEIIIKWEIKVLIKS